MDGYHIPSKHFMEIPLWIAVVAGKLHKYTPRLHIVQNVEDTVKYLNKQDSDVPVLFSVLDVNKHIIRSIVDEVDSRRIILGGYVDPEYFLFYDNVTWLDSVDELSGEFQYYDHAAAPDYTLFKWMWTVPRLTLSKGCLHSCKFCSVERVLTSMSTLEINQQVTNMRGLNFKLMYIDDKTFGQSSNWRLLRAIYEEIIAYNPEFMGFIVQTTVPYAVKYIREWVEDYHVLHVEVGVEVPSDKFLEKMNKPYRMNKLNKLINIVRELVHMDEYKVGFIPNLIFGMPDDDYVSTYRWVRSCQDIISFVNPYVLSYYSNAKGDIIGDEQERGAQDSNENTTDRTWLSPMEQKLTEVFMYKILNHTLLNLSLRADEVGVKVV
jgi:hypothetical protein